ncbi:MAG TPA: hypothetical protein PLD92_04735 [Candidatus Omnitrophota bacterium]|nr:hypothetical protein [Candidatus Omnitrophota bacterium]
MSKRMLLVCLAGVIVFVCATVMKQSAIKARRSLKTISTFSEWQEKGKPVVVAKAVKSTVDLYTKISVVQHSGNTYEAYVPRSIRVKLQPGQPFYIMEGGEKIQGTVAAVDEGLDINSGMFRVTLSFKNRSKATQQPVIAYIKTGFVSGVICVPNSAVDRQGDQNVLWIAKNDRAYKRRVVIKQRNGYGAIIDQGLQEGDIVILRGITPLRENDKLNILEVAGAL